MKTALLVWFTLEIIAYVTGVVVTAQRRRRYGVSLRRTLVQSLSWPRDVAREYL